MKVIKKTLIEKPDTTYNLHVKHNHNYVANNLVVSNCHGLKADALLSMMTGVMAHIPIRWAFTGTIPKEEFEKRSLQVSIGEIIGSVTASELQDKGVLAKCHVNIVQMIDHVVYKDYAAELKYLMSTAGRVHYMAGLIGEVSKSGNTLVLVNRIEIGQQLAASIPGAIFVSGATKSATRKTHYDSIADEDGLVVIATYGIAAVGINVPRVFNLVLIEPGRSFVRVIQSIGRGLRIAADKDHVDIYDICSTAKFSKRHLTARKKFYADAGYPYSIEKVTWND